MSCDSVVRNISGYRIIKAEIRRRQLLPLLNSIIFSPVCALCDAVYGEKFPIITHNKFSEEMDMGIVCN